VPSVLKTRSKHSGMLSGLGTSSAAPEMEMLRIKQLIALPANSIAPDINTGLRGIARLSMILDTLKSLETDKSGLMKFVEPNQFADPDAAARKLLEIANTVEAVQDGRIWGMRPYFGGCNPTQESHSVM
jgi:hypothetical protein